MASSSVELTNDDKTIISEEVQKQADALKNEANALFAGIPFKVGGLIISSIIISLFALIPFISWKVLACCGSVLQGHRTDSRKCSALFQ